MMMEVKWDFKCVKCPKYVKPNKKWHMGFCRIKDKRVAKGNTCNANPLHTRFWFWAYGISLEKINSLPDEELDEIKAQVMKEMKL